MTEITENQLQHRREVAMLEPLLPYLKVHTDKMQQAIVARARNAQQKGELTPEYAQQLWAEYLALESMVRSLQSKLRVPDLTDAENMQKLASFKRTTGKEPNGT